MNYPKHCLSFVWFLTLLACLNCVLIQKRIINGQDSDQYVKHTAVVYGWNDDYGTFGGGSFITLSHLLTAANIILKMDFWMVEYGKNTLVGQSWVRVNSSIVHPNYDPLSFENNIGILLLPDPVDQTLVTPIPLPNTLNSPYLNEQGKLSGFGRIQNERNFWEVHPWMQTGYYRRIEDSKCDFVLGHQIPETSFCAQDLDHGSSICYGDHGSGLTVYIDDINTLVGVVSIFTNQCHRDFPVVFTKVAPYTDWILEQI